MEYKIYSVWFLAMSYMYFLPPFNSADRMRQMMDCFYNEVAVMIKVSLEGHQNVINLVGCIPELPYPAIIMEYAPLGNLHGFLLKYKNQVRV